MGDPPVLVGNLPTNWLISLRPNQPVELVGYGGGCSPVGGMPLVAAAHGPEDKFVLACNT
jgi:hypothetical protein